MSSIPRATNVFTLLAWLLGVASALANCVMVGYAAWTLTLTGGGYAQADLGLFMMLTTLGTPILVACGSLLVLGVLLRAPSMRISFRHGTPLAYLLIGNLGLVAALWLYLFLMP
jgi:hypothetical protein